MFAQLKVKRINEVLKKTPKESGLYYNYLNPNTGKWCVKHATIGALADSFYEYLFKIYIYKNKEDDDLLDIYLESMKAIKEKMVLRSEKQHLAYFGEFQNDRIIKKMDHLGCFSGGLLAFTANSAHKLSTSEKKEYLELAKEITNTCHESYIKTNTHLGNILFRYMRVLSKNSFKF